jgi:hypothetical protein
MKKQEFGKSIYNNIDSNTYENKCKRIEEYYNDETRQQCSTQNGIPFIQNSELLLEDDEEETY